MPSNKDNADRVTYRASPNYRGLPWYDWVLLGLPPSESTGKESHGLGRIQGFIEYATPGYPMYYLKHKRKLSIGHIRRGSMKDNRMHVVVDCSSETVDKQELDINFITPFQLKLNDSHSFLSSGILTT